jgi:hypothetical protein
MEQKAWPPLNIEEYRSFITIFVTSLPANNQHKWNFLLVCSFKKYDGLKATGQICEKIMTPIPFSIFNALLCANMMVLEGEKCFVLLFYQIFHLLTFIIFLFIECRNST